MATSIARARARRRPPRPQVLLFTLVMLRRVAVAVACIKVASQAVAKMPSIMFFPLLPFVLEVGARCVYRYTI